MPSKFYRAPRAVVVLDTRQNISDERRLRLTTDLALERESWARNAVTATVQDGVSVKAVQDLLVSPEFEKTTETILAAFKDGRHYASVGGLSPRACRAIGQWQDAVAGLKPSDLGQWKDVTNFRLATEGV